MALTQRHAISVHDVELFLEPVGGVVSRDFLEQLTFDVERVLYEHACGEQFSAAVACSFEPARLEIDLSIPAVSGAIANRRVAEVLEQIEKRLQIGLDLRQQRVQAQDVAAAG